MRFIKNNKFINTYSFWVFLIFLIIILVTFEMYLVLISGHHLCNVTAVVFLNINMISNSSKRKKYLAQYISSNFKPCSTYKLLIFLLKLLECIMYYCLLMYQIIITENWSTYNMFHWCRICFLFDCQMATIGNFPPIA